MKPVQQPPRPPMSQRERLHIRRSRCMPAASRASTGGARSRWVPARSVIRMNATESFEGSIHRDGPEQGEPGTGPPLAAPLRRRHTSVVRTVAVLVLTSLLVACNGGVHQAEILATPFPGHIAQIDPIHTRCRATCRYRLTVRIQNPTDRNANVQECSLDS